MSFPSALQSAVFYVLACTPCMKVRHRHKARVQARKERQDKAELEAAQPGLYRHPSPFTTNPHWQDEINMGPALPKKSSTKNSSQRGLTSAGGQSSMQSVSDHTGIGSRITVGGSINNALSDDNSVSADWNKRHGYQREDEELWGQWGGNRLMDAFSKARDSAGKLIESTLGTREVTEQERHDFYFAPKNPPVNEYHPPVVSSKAQNKNAHKWMLQPPPPAKIMEGKVPVNRTISSGSKATSSTRTLVGEEIALERKLHEKKMRETQMTESELIDSLFETPTSRPISYRSRSLSFDGVDEYLKQSAEATNLEPPPKTEPTRLSRAQTVARPPGYADSDDEDESSVAPWLNRSLTTHAAQRPRLATIDSSGSVERKRPTSYRAMSKRSMKSARARFLEIAPSPVGDDTE